MLQNKKNTEKQQSDILQVVPFDHFMQDGEVLEPKSDTEYLLSDGSMLRCCSLDPLAYSSDNRKITGAMCSPQVFLPVEVTEDGQPLSLRVAEDLTQIKNPYVQVGKDIAIQREGVSCGYVYKRTEPGYVLANGSVVLEAERDAFGNYYGGAGLNGMYLRTPWMYAAVTDEQGKIKAFRLMEQRNLERPDNYLKAAEMSEEGNYNQIDGIINNEPPGKHSIRQALRDYMPGIPSPSHAPNKDQPER